MNLFHRRVHECHEDEVILRLDRIEQALTIFFQEIKKMQADMQAELVVLNGQVTNLTTVTTSAIALINGIAAQIAAAVASADTDADAVAAVTAIGTQLASNATSLAAAVTANTPAAPAGN